MQIYFVFVFVYGEKEKTDENSGHYVIASSWPPERRPLERCTLLPIPFFEIHNPLKTEIFLNAYLNCRKED